MDIPSAVFRMLEILLMWGCLELEGPRPFPTGFEMTVL